MSKISEAKRQGFHDFSPMCVPLELIPEKYIGINILVEAYIKGWNKAETHYYEEEESEFMKKETEDEFWASFSSDCPWFHFAKCTATIRDCKKENCAIFHLHKTFSEFTNQN